MPPVADNETVEISHSNAVRNNMMKKEVRHHAPISCTYDDILEMASVVKSRTRYVPEMGIICGSGLGELCQNIEDPDVIPYADIPGLPTSTVKGHKGNFVIGKFGQKIVIAMQGRLHLYEGYTAQQCVLPIRIMYILSAKVLITTNAVGGLDDKYSPGDFVMIKDHIFLPGFAGNCPFIGENDEKLGPRFFATNNVYDKELRRQVQKLAQELGVVVKQGIYAMTTGPHFETPSECLFLKNMGADFIGMSTAHEALTAKHCGMKALAFSLVTNKCITDCDDEDNLENDVHSEVLDVAARRGKALTKFIRAVVENLTF